MALYGLSSLPVDEDVVDRILTFCPTFGTLQSAMLTSKSFYNVFATRPKSITRSVAYNIVGPALPQAIRVLRFVKPDEPVNEYSDLLQSSWPETTDISASPITANEKILLAKNAELVRRLEDIFSVRHKDRTSQTTQLSSMESWRFRRAVYRNLHYCDVFEASKYRPDHHGFHFDADFIREMVAVRATMLQDYPTEELYELHAVVDFLRELVQWIHMNNLGLPHNYGDCGASIGPAHVLSAFEDRSIDAIYQHVTFDNEEMSPILFNYYSAAFAAIWKCRDVKPPPSDTSRWKALLETIAGEHDTCARQGLSPGQTCSSHGLDLWCAANYEYLPGVDGGYRTISLNNCLPGHLPDNVNELLALTELLFDSSFTYADLISEIFAIRTPEFHDWNEDDSYCSHHLKELISAHLYLWLYIKKVEGGWQPPENCWYGYECRTQTHRQAHRDSRNHLCVAERPTN
ncbi:hypothetical protein B0H10DRAFT_2082561 [Mycena sp. CBHHK59/15]|nr:hypothetical protein B0H10DRAFT_2082561 [Mycena sp. CBHHK59/15]